MSIDELKFYKYFDNTTRRLFFYLVIFDGQLYQLSNNKVDFSLEEINYGRYIHEMSFEPTHDKELKAAINQFGASYLIEFIVPAIFQEYLKNIEQNICDIDNESLKGWGE